MQIFTFGKTKKKEKKPTDFYQDSLNEEGKLQFKKLLRQGIQISMSTAV